MPKQILTLIISIVFVLLPSMTHALGFGALTLYSALGQKFDAEIQLLSLNGVPLQEIKVALAPGQLFTDAGIDYAPFYSQFIFKTKHNVEGQPVIAITSPKVVTVPFVQIIVQMSWGSGSLYREYTVLLDPPSYHSHRRRERVAQENSYPVAASAVTPEVAIAMPVKPAPSVNEQQNNATTNPAETNDLPTQEVPPAPDNTNSSSIDATPVQNNQDSQNAINDVGSVIKTPDKADTTIAPSTTQPASVPQSDNLGQILNRPQPSSESNLIQQQNSSGTLFSSKALEEQLIAAGERIATQRQVKEILNTKYRELVNGNNALSTTNPHQAANVSKPASKPVANQTLSGSAAATDGSDITLDNFGNDFDLAPASVFSGFTIMLMLLGLFFFITALIVFIVLLQRYREQQKKRVMRFGPDIPEPIDLIPETVPYVKAAEKTEAHDDVVADEHSEKIEPVFHEELAPSEPEVMPIIEQEPEVSHDIPADEEINLGTHEISPVEQQESLSNNILGDNMEFDSVEMRMRLIRVYAKAKNRDSFELTVAKLPVNFVNTHPDVSLEIEQLRDENWSAESIEISQVIEENKPQIKEPPALSTTGAVEDSFEFSPDALDEIPELTLDTTGLDEIKLTDLNDVATAVETENSNENSDNSKFDAVQMQLEMADTYIGMGDFEGARDLLSEVLAVGNDEQKQRAKELIETIINH